MQSNYSITVYPHSVGEAGRFGVHFWHEMVEYASGFLQACYPAVWEKVSFISYNSSACDVRIHLVTGHKEYIPLRLPTAESVLDTLSDMLESIGVYYDIEFESGKSPLDIEPLTQFTGGKLTIE